MQYFIRHLQRYLSLPLLLVAFTLTSCKGEVHQPSSKTNPYADFLNARLADRPPSPDLLQPVESAVACREIALDTRMRLWGIADPRSTLNPETQKELLIQAVRQIEYLLEAGEDGRWWWPDSGRQGDPNMDRFTLAPLLQSLLELKRAGLLPQEKLTAWLDQVRPAVDFQFREYGQRTDFDWSTRLAGSYPNMDAAYVLIMGVAAELFDQPDYKGSAEAMLEKIAYNIQSGGSVRYAGDERKVTALSNASPVYTGVVIRYLAEYLSATNSKRARNLLASMREHYPRAWVAPGIPENSTAPWWKHSNYVNRLGWAGCFEVIAGITGDLQNRYLAEQLLDLGRVDVADALAAVGFYDPDLRGEAPPDNIILPDPDLGGFRGRFGNFSWVGSLGPMQDTLVGALAITPQNHTVPPSFASHSLLLVSPEVGLHPLQRKSSLMNRAAYATGQTYPGASMIAADGTFAALAAQYHPRQPTIFLPENEETNWRVDQLWLFAGGNIVGVTRMTHEGDERTDHYIRMRIRTEHKGDLRQTDSKGAFSIGDIGLRLLETNFPKISHGGAQSTDNRSGPPNADEIALEENKNHAEIRLDPEGRAFYQTALHIHYGGHHDIAFQELEAPGFLGFRATLNHRAYAFWFNIKDTGQLLEWPLPSDIGEAAAVYVTDGRAQSVKPRLLEDRAANVAVPPYGIAAIVWESPDDRNTPEYPIPNTR